MPTVVDDKLNQTSEPLTTEDLLIVITMNALKQGQITADEIVGILQTLNRDDIVEQARDLLVDEEPTDAHPETDDPEPDHSEEPDPSP